MINETGVLPPTVYPSDKRRVVLMLLGALAFVALGVGLLIWHGSVKAVIGGVLAVPFFGACAVLYGIRLVKGRPELIIDQAGVEHAQLGRIAWQEIAGLRIREMTVRSAKQRFIELLLHDPAGYLARAPRLVKMTASGNRGLGFGPANISANTLPVGSEEVIAAMLRHQPQLAVYR
ncbi:STM3941 family protein [Kitasatospora acidiphila]|nr:STM3941 family protein [Kitasatospora acidiphila]